MKRKLRVCTIGGGSGMPIINKALVRAGFDDIRSIVTTFDSGGDTGRMRTDERGNMLAFSDFWRSILSLWVDGLTKKSWEEMLRFRDGRGRNFGNSFFQFMAEKSGDLSLVQDVFSDLVGARMRGKVVPVSTLPADLVFETNSRHRYKGEHYLDDFRMSFDRVKKIWLEPSVEANAKAIDSILGADVVIISPGSLYGSILVNFLPKGMVEAFNKSRAKKVLIANTFSVANEVDEMSLDVCYEIFRKYLGKKLKFDLILFPDFKVFNQSTLNKVVANYALEHAKPLFLEKKYKEVVEADILSIDMVNMRLRHSEKKLSKVFLKLLVK